MAFKVSSGEFLRNLSMVCRSRGIRGGSVEVRFVGRETNRTGRCFSADSCFMGIR